MEEQKKTKEETMKIVEDKQKKLSYEELNDVCNQLWQQNQQLTKKCRELDVFNMFKRLDYLFKVVELSSTIADAEFTNNCIDEIKILMTPPKEEESKEES